MKTTLPIIYTTPLDLTRSSRQTNKVAIFGPFCKLFTNTKTRNVHYSSKYLRPVPHPQLIILLDWCIQSRLGYKRFFHSFLIKVVMRSNDTRPSKRPPEGFKVDRYWLRIDALAQPISGSEVPPPYASGNCSERRKQYDVNGIIPALV
jgi:hypothetical protein